MHNTSTAPARLRPAVLAGAAALALGALIAAEAQAHDTLISSSPEEGETLTEPPAEVVLEFSGAGLTTGEAITNDIWLLDAEDENWASEEPAEVEGSTMRTEIPEPLPNGDYQVQYRVVYSDGHSEERSFNFEVDSPLTEDEEDAALATPEGSAEEDDGAEVPEAELTEDETSVPAEEPEQAENESPTAPTDSEEQDSGGWGGIIGWGLLAAAVLVLAGAVGYAASRRRRSAQNGPAGQD